MNIYPLYEINDLTVSPIKTINKAMDNINGYFPMHWHKQLEIIYIEKGNGIFLLDNEKIKVTDADLVFISPNMFHYGEILNETLQCKVIILDLSFFYANSQTNTQKFIQDLLLGKKQFKKIINHNYNNYNKIKECFFKMYSNNTINDFQSELSLSTWFYQLIYLLNNNKLIKKSTQYLYNNNFDKIREVIHYIVENIDSKISIDILASISGYSKHYFMTYFKNIMGTTIITFINELRLQKAAETLLITNKNILETGLDCGFNNHSYFIKLFKNRFSLTPKDYRKKFR